MNDAELVRKMVARANTDRLPDTHPLRRAAADLAQFTSEGPASFSHAMQARNFARARAELGYEDHTGEKP